MDKLSSGHHSVRRHVGLQWHWEGACEAMPRGCRRCDMHECYITGDMCLSEGCVLHPVAESKTGKWLLAAAKNEVIQVIIKGVSVAMVLVRF